MYLNRMRSIRKRITIPIFTKKTKKKKTKSLPIQASNFLKLNLLIPLIKF